MKMKNLKMPVEIAADLRKFINTFQITTLSHGDR